MGKSAQPYSFDEIRAVRRLADDGLNDREIERETGIPARRVKGIRSKHGIESPYTANRKRTFRRLLSPEELEYLRRLVNYRPGHDYAKDEASEAVSVSWSS